MAQRSTVHRVNIDLCDSDRQVYESLQMSIARADSETAHRVVARLIGYCLFYEPDIAFTGGVGAGDEPDVWVKEPGGRVKLWLDVGLPDPKRLAKASRHCGQVVLLAYGRRVGDWYAEHRALLQPVHNLTLIEIDYAFLDQLASGMERTVSWSLTVSGGTLYLTSGDQQYETTPQPFGGV